VRLLVFELAGSPHAVDASAVEEVAAVVAMTPLYGAAPEVEGVVDYRGRLVAVLDPRRMFRMAPKSVEITDHLIFLRSGGRLFGLRVDRALDLVEADAERVGRAQDGIARLEGGLVVIHDVERLLPDEEARRIEQAINARQEEAR
jgi:purine-binding chemotaxis protein CheW